MLCGVTWPTHPGWGAGHYRTAVDSRMGLKCTRVHRHEVRGWGKVAQACVSGKRSVDRCWQRYHLGSESKLATPTARSPGQPNGGCTAAVRRRVRSACHPAWKRLAQPDRLAPSLSLAPYDAGRRPRLAAMRIYYRFAARTPLLPLPARLSPMPSAVGDHRSQRNWVGNRCPVWAAEENNNRIF